MDSRIFGKELTNLLGNDPQHKKTYSHIHGEKLKDQSLNLIKHNPGSTVNQSLVLKVEKEQGLKLDRDNPQLVPDYFMDNLRFLKQQEKETSHIGNYISLQTTVTESERAKLIDWLAKMHYKYKMFPETLFTIVSLIDQYLKVKDTAISELQLVGVAALYIAAKFE